MKEYTQRIKLLVRRGVPCDKKAEVWTHLSGAYYRLQQNPNFYQQVLADVFGARVPDKFYRKVPTFSLAPDAVPTSFEQVVPKHMLTQQGIKSAQRILWTINMYHPEIEYCPAIPRILSLLLLYLTESEAFTVLHELLERSRLQQNEGSTRWHLALTMKQSLTFTIVFKRLIYERWPAMGKHLDSLGFDIVPFFLPWFETLFFDAVPLHVILCLMGVFLSEGNKIMIRLGLALFKQNKKAVMLARSSDEVSSLLRSKCLALRDVQPVFKLAFGIYLNTEKHTQRKALRLKRAPTDDTHPEQDSPTAVFHRPRLNSSSEIIADHHFEAIWSWLPVRFRIQSPQLVFCTSEDGRSMTTLFSKCGLEEYRDNGMVFLIKAKNSNGQVTLLGGFCPTMFRESNTAYGTGECFVFTIEPEEHKYAWTGDNDQHIRSNKTGFHMGSGKEGPAISLSADLSDGMSYCSGSYGNPKPLSGGETFFSCLVLEVYSLVSS
eukprot:GILK01005799.1.p1 GENE.GILK01005799.1~~GILK01005799.1.p1  ORF type:complete len:571 (-),score=82.39 GILK01005799.1:179-1648(-)